MYDLKYIQTDDINFQMKKKTYILKQNFKLCRILQGHFVKKKYIDEADVHYKPQTYSVIAGIRHAFIFQET